METPRGFLRGARHICAVAVVMAWAPVGWSEERSSASRSDDDLMVQEEGGVRTLSLRDWPASRANGVIRPVSLEEYLSLKFGQVRDRFKEGEERLDALNRQLRRVEAEQDAVQKRLLAVEQATHPPQEVTHGRATEDHQQQASQTGSSGRAETPPQLAQPVDGR